MAASEYNDKYIDVWYNGDKSYHRSQLSSRSLADRASGFVVQTNNHPDDDSVESQICGAKLF